MGSTYINEGRISLYVYVVPKHMTLSVSSGLSHIVMYSHLVGETQHGVALRSSNKDQL